MIGGVVDAETQYLADYRNLTGYSQTLAEESSVYGYRNYIYGHDHLALSQIDGTNGPQFFHGDHLGTTRLLTNSGGIATDIQNYEPFGTPSNTALSSLTDYYFTGQRRDPATDLQYHRARWLNTGQGRWLSTDPVFDFPGNFGNGWLYASTNPIAHMDPQGLFSLMDLGAATAIRSVLSVMRFALIGGVIGGAMGGVDAYLAGNDVWKGIAQGLVFGFIVTALLVAFPYAAVLLVPWFVRQAAIAAGDASGSGNMALARYRLATMVLMIGAAGLGGGIAAGKSSLIRKSSQNIVKTTRQQHPAVHPLLRLQERTYKALEKHRSRIENVPEQPVILKRPSRSGTYNKNGSAKHNNMIEAAIDVLLEEKVLDISQGPIYKGSRQIKITRRGEEVTTTWAADTKAYRMPDIIGRSPNGEIVNVNISFRNSVAYEMEAITAITNADINAASALFIFRR